MKLRALFLAFTKGFVIYSVLTHAHADPSFQCQENCVAVGEWQLGVAMGLGLRTNPLAGEKDTPLLLLPELSYYGKRFFINNMELGFTIAESARHQLNVLVMPSYDQMYFNRWDPLNFVADPQAIAAPNPQRTYNVEVSYLAPMSSSSSGATIAGRQPQRLAIRDINAVFLNGEAIPITAASEWMGADDNLIRIEVDDSGGVLISGVSERDVIVLQSDQGDAVSHPVTQVGVEDEQLISKEVAASPENAFSTRAALVNLLTPRRTAALAGLEYTYDTAWASFHFNALTDLAGVHDGQELRFAMTVPWRVGDHQFSATLGGNWQSKEILQYYYGVTALEAGNPAWEYRPSRGAVASIARVAWQKQLNENWALRGFWQVVAANSQIKNSPIVDRSAVHSVFIGGVYHF